MEIIIDLDSISNASKKKWLINTLNSMGIGYHTTEHPQTLAQYNRAWRKAIKKLTTAIL